MIRNLPEGYQTQLEMWKVAPGLPV